MGLVLVLILFICGIFNYVFVYMACSQNSQNSDFYQRATVGQSDQEQNIDCVEYLWVRYTKNLKESDLNSQFVLNLIALVVSIIVLGWGSY